MELGFASVILEGDSEVVFKDLSSTEPSFALHGHIIHDIKQWASHSTCIRFSHTRRTGNCVAHALARRAISSPAQNIWMDYALPDIFHVVQADLASLC